MAEPLSADQVRRRYLLLTALRWLPVGLAVPVVVLVPLARGLSLTDIGIAAAAQGLAVLLLELPTGGLADVWGRRPVLLVAGLFGVAAFGLYLTAGSLATFFVAWLVMGVFRALESGPLEAWYVDTALVADPDADIETTLARAGSLVGFTLAAGAGVTAVLQAVMPPVDDPFSWTTAITLPLVVALALSVVHTVLLAFLVREVIGPDADVRLRDAVRGVPRVVRDSVGTVARSTPLRALLGVSAVWGLTAAAAELLWQPRLEDFIGTTASPLFGISTIAMFAGAGLGSAVAPWLTRRSGDARRAAMVCKLVQGAALVGLAATGGPVGLIVVLGLAFAALGANEPIHMGLLHRATTADRRTTVVSANSLSGLAAAAVGSIAAGALAESAGIGSVWVIGGVALAASAPLYRWAGRPDAAGAVPADLAEPAVTP